MKVAIFFTRSTSLKTWIERGLFEREKLIYERHLKDGTFKAVYWLTYGLDDEVLAKDLKQAGMLDTRVHVHGRPQWFPGGKIGQFIYSFLLPLLNARILHEVDLLKTNQLDGAWAGVIAHYVFRKPLILRCGYVQSQLETYLSRIPRWRLKLMLVIERWQYRHADLAIVTSEHNARYIADTHAVPKEKIRLIPNYIDQELFSPAPDSMRTNRLEHVLYVGRFSPEKNLDALIKAVAIAKLPLDLVGAGPLERHLHALACKLGVKIRILGTVPNSHLPSIINRYHYFALTSFSEGMPKTLLEAMACGVICVGTNVDGINEVIHDSVDGYLAKGVDAKAISAALKRAQTAQKEFIGMAARTEILRRYTLTAVAQREKELFLNLVK